MSSADLKFVLTLVCVLGGAVHLLITKDGPCQFAGACLMVLALLVITADLAKS